MVVVIVKSRRVRCVSGQVIVCSAVWGARSDPLAPAIAEVNWLRNFGKSYVMMRCLAFFHPSAPAYSDGADSPLALVLFDAARVEGAMSVLVTSSFNIGSPTCAVCSAKPFARSYM